jgi:hypothetical protein
MSRDQRRHYRIVVQFLSPGICSLVAYGLSGEVFRPVKFSSVTDLLARFEAAGIPLGDQFPSKRPESTAIVYSGAISLSDAQLDRLGLKFRF